MSDCIFCRIVAKEVPANIAYEDDEILAFQDIYPLAPVHLLVIPKKHIPSVNGLEDEDAQVMGKLFLVIKKLAQKAGIAESGYRVITNIGKDGAQEVNHLHFHLIGGKFLGKKISANT